MPLVLSLKTGQDFYVGGERFVIGEVFSEAHFMVTRASTGESFEVTDLRATEILTDVFVSAGERPQAQLARVAIEAPSDVLVLRGDKFRNPPAHLKARPYR
jgi:hypothetical protein